MTVLTAASDIDKFIARWTASSLEGSQGDHAFDQGRYPAIAQAWRRAWECAIPFFAFADKGALDAPANGSFAIPKSIYTTNAVEALDRSLHKIVKTRGSFPTGEAACKLLYLAVENAGVHWRRPAGWTAAMSQFAIQFGERFPSSGR